MPSNNSKAQRESRLKAAQERQRKHDALTVDQKIVKAAERPGDSNKEITRLGKEAGIYNDIVDIGGKKFGVRR